MLGSELSLTPENLQSSAASLRYFSHWEDWLLGKCAYTQPIKVYKWIIVRSSVQLECLRSPRLCFCDARYHPQGTWMDAVAQSLILSRPLQYKVIPSRSTLIARLLQATVNSEFQGVFNQQCSICFYSYLLLKRQLCG